MRWTPIRRSKRETRDFAQVPPIPSNSAMGGYRAGSVTVTNETALRASAVWAALRLRANLVSSMPIDAYRVVNGVQVEVNLPAVEWYSGGQEIHWGEALYATQFDLDRAGNAFGIITQRNALGLPARIELVPLDSVGLRPRRHAASIPEKGPIEYMIGGESYSRDEVWHERQYVVAGLAVGLSPVAYSAYSTGSYLSAQRFALDWFGNSGMPAVLLQNTERTIPQDVATETKSRYQASATPGGVFVAGNDWELKPIQAVSAQDQYVDLMKFGVPDIARFFDVPADLIDGSIPGSSITYSNIGQRNVQLLTMSIGPTVKRREDALSALLPRPRFIKLNRDALLAMDPSTRTDMFGKLATARLRTPTELRALDNLAPFSTADLAEIEKVWGPPKSAAKPPADDAKPKTEAPA